ncbi:hypothetical protein C9374_012197 [Naegleria lovaniensis]|uniref:Uncharacterized protein n=1 Tax=Naegleria lovaniensis TaxID=51637 RepID=A0AA88GBB6_NAELO|nr:uncharacterized protein C9374_012197 [Naegleria lovaniensis]KAG2373331.1 hypothetical protein C9374_012197 [Naegleria lovaniensis]
MPNVMHKLLKFFKPNNDESAHHLVHSNTYSIQEEDPILKRKQSPEMDVANDTTIPFDGHEHGQETTKKSLFEKELKFTLFSRNYSIRLALIITLVSTVVMVLTRSVDFVLIVRISTQMQNYSVFLSSVLLPILFCVLLWPIVWFKMFVTKSITKEMRTFPLYKFAILGLLSCISNLISVVPSAYIDGDLNVALNQAVIINNVLLSFLFLSIRYNILHLGGILLVAIGIGLDLLPTFLLSSSPGKSISSQLFWALLIFLSTVVSAASNVYTEKCLRDVDMDVWYMQTWTMVFNLIFGLFTIPIAFIPFPPPYSALNISQFGEYLGNGFKCFAGMNSAKGDACEMVWAVILVFMCFNLAFNISMLFVFKYGSSTLAVISAALRLVLSTIGFMIPILAGPATSSHLTAMDLEALAILVLGVIMYSVTKEKRLEKDPIHEKLKKFVGEPVKRHWEELKEKIKQLICVRR